MKIEAHDWKIEVKEGYVIVEHKDLKETNQYHKIFEPTTSYQTGKIDFKPKSDTPKSSIMPPPPINTKHTDRYGKELKVGDRIYLEEGQEAINLTGEAYWKSQHIEFNDCFTILEIDNKITTCDWGLDRTGNKILTSELSKFTKI